MKIEKFLNDFKKRLWEGNASSTYLVAMMYFLIDRDSWPTDDRLSHRYFNMHVFKVHLKTF